MKKMNNRIVIIGIIIILMIGLGSVGAFLILNQKHPIALTTPVNNTTTNNTTLNNTTTTNSNTGAGSTGGSNSQNNQNTVTNTDNSNNNVDTNNQPTETPARIAQFEKEFPNGDGPPSSYQPN
jgi:hypothetical protein